MNKRLNEQYQKFLYKNQQTPLSFGTICVVVLCLLGLIVATFTQVDISHFWFHKAASGNIEMFVKHYPYIPQIPVLLATVAILGIRFGTITLISYVLMGFFMWPVFAFGGGLGYIKSAFFGYILGYFPAVIIAGRILARGKSIKNIVLASLFGVLAIHICGILYSLILGMSHLADFELIYGTIITQTGAKICYDLVFSIVAILISIPVKYVLWLAMDVAVVRKPKRFRKKPQEQLQ